MNKLNSYWKINVTNLVFQLGLIDMMPLLVVVFVANV